MATKFSSKVFRETVDVTVTDKGKRREIVVGLEPGDIISFRLKRTRQVVAISAKTGYEYAMKLAGEHTLRQKRSKT